MAEPSELERQGWQQLFASFQHELGLDDQELCPCQQCQGQDHGAHGQ